MCVAVIIPAGAALPTLEQHEQMAEANPDGAGYAWVDTDAGLVMWRKGFDSASFAQIHAELAALPSDVPILLHYRIATVGGVRPELTHPFPITAKAGVKLTGGAKSVLVHNGTWCGFVSTRFDDLIGPVSDTRALAILTSHEPDALRELAPLYGRSARLNADCTVERHGRWREVQGVLYSNTYWEYTAKYVAPAYVYSAGTTVEPMPVARPVKFDVHAWSEDLRSQRKRDLEMLEKLEARTNPVPRLELAIRGSTADRWVDSFSDEEWLAWLNYRYPDECGTELYSDMPDDDEDTRLFKPEELC